MKKLLLTPLMLLSVTANASFFSNLDFSSLIEGARQTVIDNKYAVATAAGLTALVAGYRYAKKSTVSTPVDTKLTYCIDRPITVQSVSAAPQDIIDQQDAIAQIFDHQALAMEASLEELAQTIQNGVIEVIEEVQEDAKNLDAALALSLQPLAVIVQQAAAQPAPVAAPRPRPVPTPRPTATARPVPAPRRTAEQQIPAINSPVAPIVAPVAAPRPRPVPAPRPTRQEVVRENMERFVTARTTAQIQQPVAAQRELTDEEQQELARKVRMARLSFGNALSNGTMTPARVNAAVEAEKQKKIAEILKRNA